MPELENLRKKAERCRRLWDKLDVSEEKRTLLKAYIQKHAAGCVKLSQVPNAPGIWFSDSLQDYGTMRGPMNGGIIGELMQYAGNGAVLNLMVTGKGTPAGCAVTPALIITANRDTQEKMGGDVDILIDPEQEMQAKILERICRTMNGSLTASEQNGQFGALLFQNAQEM